MSVVVELPWTGERLVPQLVGDIAHEHLHRYALAVALANGKEILDLACGEGYGANLLAQVAREVIGVDSDEAAVEHARQAYPAGNLRFDVGTCDAVPLPAGSVDLVVSFETIEHHARHREMMAEIRRVLRPGGALIISTPDRREYSELPGYTNPFHIRELSRAEFADLLAAAFEHTVVYGQRMYCGSVVAPLDDRPTPFATHCGGFTAATSAVGLSRARYLIGLAWDGEAAPVLAASLFEGDGLLTEVQRQTATLAVEVDRLTAAVADRDAVLRRLRAAITADGGAPDSVADPSANGTGTVERLAREHVSVLERLAGRIEALPATGASLDELAALRDDVRYWRLVCRARRAADAAIPIGATIAVVTRGDDRLLDLSGRRAWHFPRAEDGGYAGQYPADDAAAVAHLEALRALGAEYLLVPTFGLWWLNDYPEFGCHVKRNYQTVYSKADECVIFKLKK
jgi:SAM-dependent methyltransferase